MFLAMAEVVVMVMLAYGFYTQVFIPIQRGTSLFPMFRREAVLRDAITEERQRGVEKQLEDEIKNERRRK